MSEITFDHIIIGAGTAGCLLANRLSANKSKRVLLIEAGRKDDYHWIHIPVGYLYCIGNPRTDWMYQTESNAGLNGRKLRYPRGKVLGGCSSINGMIYMRGQSRDYDAWSEAVGDADWRWDNCLADFKAHEHHYKLDGASGSTDASRFAQWHGHRSHDSHASPDINGVRSGGEWRVEKQRLSWEILDAFAQAANQAGIPSTPDFNTGNNEGVGYFEVNQKSGWRWNTAKAFLRPTCYGRPNFEMWTSAQVVRLQIDKTEHGVRCTGAQVWTGQEMLTVNLSSGGEVILSAGAIGSPQILQLSGIGDAKQLQAAGVQSIVHLPGVGANLQDHLQIRAVYKVKNVPTLNTLANSWWGKARIGFEYAFNRSGPMSMAPSQLGVFTKSDAGRLWPNLQYHVQPLSLDAFGEPLHSFPAFTASVCNLNPTSRGSVTLQSNRFEDSPAIAPNYLSTDSDRKVAADSLRVTRRIVHQSAMAKYEPEEWKPGPQYQNDDLAKPAGDIATTIFHPVGTTKMGRNDDAMAVVDSHLRVRNGRGASIAGLRVVDAGVMPTITSGNTNSPTLMIAEKAARWIAQGI